VELPPTQLWHISELLLADSPLGEEGFPAGLQAKWRRASLNGNKRGAYSCLAVSKNSPSDLDRHEIIINLFSEVNGLRLAGDCFITLGEFSSPRTKTGPTIRDVRAFARTSRCVCISLFDNRVICTAMRLDEMLRLLSPGSPQVFQVPLAASLAMPGLGLRPTIGAPLIALWDNCVGLFD
jgi:hypothetical protein